MDQVLPGYAEECRLMRSKPSQSIMGYPLDDISPNFDMNHHYSSMKNETVQFPGDPDSLSLYFNPNRKDDTIIHIAEGQRKKIRRERNKVAASKCRNKRKEHIRFLMKESDQLERKNNDLHSEISLLHIEIKELETMLDSHRCHMKIEKSSP